MDSNVEPHLVFLELTLEHDIELPELSDRHQVVEGPVGQVVVVAILQSAAKVPPVKALPG